MKKLINMTALISLTFLLCFSLTSCDQQPTDSIAGPGIDNTDLSIDKKSKKLKDKYVDVEYPLYGEAKLRYKNKKGWGGAKIKLEDGTKLTIKNSSLTPPEGTSTEDIVTITVQADKIETEYGTELVFTFGPHGSSFAPGAKIELYWAELGVDLAQLYYINDGEYELQDPDHICIKNKKMTLTVDHFSRYAVAYGR